MNTLAPDTTPIRLLIVDSDTQWLEYIAPTLQQAGFEVFTAITGVQALRVLKRATPELLLLNIFLSDTDGVEICGQLRQIQLTIRPVVVLLAEENQDYALLAGFEAGADDFVRKDMKVKLLIYKLQALVNLCFHKRKEIKQPLVCADFSLDEESYTLTREGQQYLLTKKECELLAFLLSAPNHLFSREEIATQIWGGSSAAKSRTIDVHIGKLRDKLGQERIKTVKGVGYRLVKNEA